MKAKRLLTSLALVASTCAALHAQYDPSLRPIADAQWDFENENNLTENSIAGSALSIECGTAGIRTFQLGENKITSIAGPSEKDKAITVFAGDIFKMNVGTTETVSSYTLLWNVRISNANKYHALLQTDPGNTNDGDLFINRNTPSVGLHLPSIGFGYGGNATFNEWHTIVLSVTDGVPTTYMDGSLLVAATGADDRFKLQNGFALLFCDEDGNEYDDIDVAQVAYWNKALTLEEAFPADPNADMPELVDGFYQLEDANDLNWFAKRVNNGETAINAVLTNDIDMEGVEFTPIGKESAKYNGKFDGQGHVISNLIVNLPGQDYVGVFGMITGGAEIKNFTVDNTCSFSGQAFVAVIGGSKDAGGKIITIDGIGCEATITGSAQNIAGIYGVNMGSTAIPLISNCYVTGKITGARESGAITGWAQKGTISNCYSIAEVVGSDGADKDFHRGSPTTIKCYTLTGVQGTTAITEEDLASGKLTYLLNGMNRNQSDIRFVQTLEENNYPVLSGAKQVYFYCCDGIDCKGNPKGEHYFYTNDADKATVVDEHNFVEGVCTVCDLINEDGFQPNEEGVYEISTPQGLYYFANRVCTRPSREVFKARLTADIDYTKFNSMIGGRGDEQNFAGEFDGQGHTVTINLTEPNNCPHADCALFGGINNATIKNLILEGTINSPEKYAAALVGHAWGTNYIENVISNVNIISTVNGDATNGGLIAVNNNSTTTNIKNVLIAGSQQSETAHSCGAIVGWIDGKVNAENVLVIADLQVSTENSDITGRNNGNFNGTNVYYAHDCRFLVPTSFQGKGADYSKATETNAEEMAGGDLAVILGWGQALGVDAYPSPLSANKVYKYGTTLTNTYYPGLEMPVLSTHENPVFYYIKNVRRNQYVNYTGAQMTQVAAPAGYENMFYFVAAGEPQGNFVPVTIHNAVAGGKAMTDFMNWGEATAWNILTQMSGDRSSTDGLFIGMASSTDMGNTSIWWNDHSGQYVGSWNCDAGSVWTFEPVAIEEVPEMVTLTYNHINNGQVLKVQKGAVIAGSAYPAPALPAYVTATTPEGTVDNDATVDIEVEFTTPFKASTDYATANWYNLIGHIDGPKYLHYTEGEMRTGDASYEDKYLWSFYGNPYEGYKVMNRAAGDGVFLNVPETANGVAVTMNENATVWSIASRDENVFGFGANGFFVNRHGGVSATVMKLWQNGPAGDNGSTLMVEAVDIVNDATPTAIASKNGVTLLSTATELVIAAYATSSVQIVDETAQVVVYDYFADKTYNITPVVDGNKVKIILPEAYASSALLYVTIPAGMIQLYGTEVLGEAKYTYYVHGSEIITEEAIAKIMSIIGGGATAIEGIVSGQTTVDVYSINGAAVKKGANAADLKALKGIYIVNGKKVILK